MAKRILLVDDEPEIRMLIANRLRSEGYQVQLAESGEEAIRLTKVVKPDLVVLDVMLPGMSGDEVYACLKEDKKTARIPIIFLTALKTKEDDVKLGFDVGTHTIFAKPIDPQEFLGTVREILAGKNA